MTSKILNGTTEITGIKSVVYTESVNAGDGLRPGAVCAAKIDVEVYGAQSSAPSAGDALTYYQVDENGNETLIGTFYAEPSIPTRNTFHFTAYDAVAKLDKPYSERLNAIQNNFPMSIYALVADACSVAGVTLGSASWPLSTQTVEAFYADVTCRNILQYAAEIAGRFVRCNSSGDVIFDWYTTATTGIKPGADTGYVPYKQGGLTYDNYSVLTCDAVAIKPAGTEGAAYIYPTTFGTVTATDPNGDGNVILQNLVVTDDGNGNLYLSVGAEDDGNGNVEITESASASNTLILSGNLLLTNATEATYIAAAQNIYNVMSSLPSYRHATVNLFTFLNPFRAGQFISVTDAQGVSFTFPVFEMKVEASAATLMSSGKESYDTDSASTEKQLANLANNIVQIDRLKVGYAEIEEAVIHTLETEDITAKNLTVIDDNGDVVATYNEDVIIGREEESHLFMDYHSLMLVAKGGNAYLDINDMRDRSGVATVFDSFTGDGTTKTFQMEYSLSQDGTSTVTVDNVELVVDADYTISGTILTLVSAPSDGAQIDVEYTTSSSTLNSFTFGGRDPSTVGPMSVSFGLRNIASGGYSSVFGYRSSATGKNSHAEGQRTSANGDFSHAEGIVSSANGNASHAEGDSTEASGANSHSEGRYSEANGDFSHAQNMYTIADGDAQTTLGKYNVADTTSAVIVGNGTYNNARSNALTLDWNGNAVLAGGLTLNGNVDILSALFYSIGDTFSMVGQTSFAGAVTASSQTIYLNVPVDKLLDNISSISVTSLTGGIRAVNGNYVNGVTDGNEWVGLSGITISAAKASGRNVRVTITSTSAFTSGGSTLTNNTPLTLVGTVTLSFS